MSEEIKGIPEVMERVLGMINDDFDRPLMVLDTKEIRRDVDSMGLKGIPAVVVCEVWEETRKRLFSSKVVRCLNPIIAVCRTPGSANRWDTVRDLEIMVWEEPWRKVSSEATINEPLQELAKGNFLHGGVVVTTLTKQWLRKERESHFYFMYQSSW